MEPRRVKCCPMLALLVAMALALGTSGAGAAKGPGSQKKPGLGPAIMQRLDKATADLKRQLQAAGLKHYSQQAVMEMLSAVHYDLKAHPVEALDALSIEVDEADLDGLEDYARGEYDQAAASFEKSLAAKPSKEFPAYFLGCIAFQRGKYAQAADRFQAVYKENKSCTTACFLSILSDFCAKHARPVGQIDLVLLANQAAEQAASKLQPQKSGTEGEDELDLKDRATRGPLDFRYRQAAMPILTEYMARLVADALKEKDPEKQAALALLIRSREIREALLARIAEQNPKAPDLQNVAFLAHYFTHGHYSEKDTDQFRKDLAQAIKREPDNGALLLLQIPQERPFDVRVSQPPFFETHYPPLTDAEIDLLHRAAQAPRFTTYRAFQESFRQAYANQRLSGLGLLSFVEGIDPYLHWDNTFSRIGDTLQALVETGKEKQAGQVFEDALTVIGRIERQPPEFPPGLAGLKLSISVPLYESLRLKKADALIERAAEVLTAADYEETSVGMAFHDVSVVGLLDVPLPVLNEAEMPLMLGELDMALYRRLLQDNHKAWLKKALDAYVYHEKKAAEGQPDPYAREGLALAADRLGDLADPAGLPALKEMATNKEPLVAYSARAALEKIEAAQKAKKPGRKP